MNVGKALPRNAQHFPRKIAIVDKKRSLTYLEFHLRTNRLANYLLEQGIAPGDPVGLACGNRSEHCEVLFALAKIGAVAVPFDYHWTLRECDAMVNFFAPKAFILEERTETRDLEASLGDRLAPGRLIVIDPKQAWSYEEALSAAGSETPELNVDGKDIFLIMITSGTTGFPKGCLVNHETYALRSMNNAITKGFGQQERALLTLPLHFNAGRGSMMGILYLGGTVFIQEKFDEEAFLGAIERERITYTLLVPTLCDRLLGSNRLGSYDLSSLSYLGITSGHLSREAAAAMIERVCTGLYEAYASTDCGQITILSPEDRSLRGDTVGRPIWCVLLKMVDEQGEEIPMGEEGEICVRSPLAIQGYYRNPRATEEFFHHGWCHTGDIGFLDAEGYLHVSGRKKNMIKSGGISIFPEEIEEVLLGHPAVADAAVIGFKSPDWGEAVKALVVLKDKTNCEAEILIGFCKEALAPYKAPKVVEFVASLPRTAMGKIDRGRLESAIRRK